MISKISWKLELLWKAKWLWSNGGRILSPDVLQKRKSKLKPMASRALTNHSDSIMQESLSKDLLQIKLSKRYIRLALPQCCVRDSRSHHQSPATINNWPCEGQRQPIIKWGYEIIQHPAIEIERVRTNNVFSPSCLHTFSVAAASVSAYVSQKALMQNAAADQNGFQNPTEYTQAHAIPSHLPQHLIWVVFPPSLYLCNCLRPTLEG